jgi:undecaprenyl-diphosphatase
VPVDVLGSGPWTGGSHAHRDAQARRELVVGAVLVLVMVVGGVYVAIWPGTGLIDRLGLDVVQVHRSGAFTQITRLRYPTVVVIASVVLAAIALPRDRARALACLIGPPLALATSELVAKPLVGRTLGGSLSYPSGTAVGAAALATAAVLVTPDRWRVATAMVAGVYALWSATAVVALQWHLPTDALAGVSYGAGVVLVADGLAWVGLGAVGRKVAHRHTGVPVEPRPG